MAERITLSCSGCQKKLAVPLSAAGKRIKCPGCHAVNSVSGLHHDSPGSCDLPSSAQKSQQSKPRPSRPPAEVKQIHRTPTVKKSSRSADSEARSKTQRQPKSSHRSSVEDNWLMDESFEDASYGAAMPPKQRKKKKPPEKPRLRSSGNEPPPVNRGPGMSLKERLIYGGGLKGVLMMIGGTVWLVVGLMGGRLFFYAPVVIIVGLFTSVKSLFGDY